MKLKEWFQLYLAIALEMGLKQDMDKNAAKVLSEILQNSETQRSYSRIRDLLHGSRCYIFGAGPSLEKDARQFKELRLDDRSVIVAADGASSCLIAEGILPDIIVSDLDGRMLDILRCYEDGSYIVVHAHGDNIHLLNAYAGKFRQRVIGTTQVEPVPNVWNFGGFTDGDRAVLMCEELGCSSIFLFGMDLGDKVGRFSKPSLTSNVNAWPTKQKKLQIAKMILETFAKNSRAELYNVTYQGEDINGFRRLTIDELKNAG